MGTIFCVVGGNLTVAYFEKKRLLFYHRFIPNTWLTFFIPNYCRILNEVFHK